MLNLTLMDQFLGIQDLLVRVVCCGIVRVEVFVKAVGDHAFWSSTLFQNGAFRSSAKKHGLRPKKKKNSFRMFYFSPNAKIKNCSLKYFFFIPRVLLLTKRQNNKLQFDFVFFIPRVLLLIKRQNNKLKLQTTPF